VVMREALSRFTIEPATELERTRRRAITISPRGGARLVLRARGAATAATPRPAALAPS
jgi:hypothetical protein